MFLTIYAYFILMVTAVGTAIGQAEAQADRSIAQQSAAGNDVQALQEQLPNGLFPQVVNTLQNDASFSYRVIPTSSGYQFHNSTHNLTTHFSSQGVHLSTTDGSDWHWGMRLVGYGREGHITEVSQTQPVAEGNRVVYGHSGITEWYVNGPLGLQQGFTISRAPHPNLGGHLVVQVGLSGDVQAEVSKSGEQVALRQVSGVASLRYGGLYVYDSVGKVLPAWLASASASLSIVVDDAEAQYPITVDPFVQEDRLDASDGIGDSAHRLGTSVSVDGNTAVVGAPGDDELGPNAGAAYVFSNESGTWTQVARLTASDAAENDGFGYSVSIDGNTIVVGVENERNDGWSSAYVFSNESGTWTETAILRAESAWGGFGHSVSVSGNTIVVGAQWKVDNSGAVYVFSNAGGTWTRTARLFASDGAERDQFGHSVSIDGSTIVVGASHDDDKGENSGAVYVFSNAGGTWTQTAKLTASDGAAHDIFGASVSVDGSTLIVGGFYEERDGWGAAYVFSNAGGAWTQAAKLTAESPGGSFGHSVLVDGNIIVVGAERRWNEDLENDSGAVYVFTNNSGAWTQAAKLTPEDGNWGDHFGRSVSIYNNTIVVGASHDDDKGNNSGSAYVFSNAGGVWNQDAKLTGPQGTNGDEFGYSVSADGNTTVVGAYAKENRKGSAYVFTNAGGAWTETAKLTADDGAEFDRFGYSISISGNTIVVGAYYDGDKGRFSGSAYVFTNESGTWTQTAKLIADDGARFDFFGRSVSISGNAIVVGAHLDDDKGSNSGSAYVFTNNGGAWAQSAKLTADDGDGGDFFGRLVSISGNTIVVGAYRDDDKGDDSGSAYVFTNNGGAWAQSAKLTADDGDEHDEFGFRVSIDGNTIVVGARYDDDKGDDSGSAYVFTNNGGAWAQSAKLTADDGDGGDNFGDSVSIDGRTIVVGARLAWNDEWENDSGSAYVFSKMDGTWMQAAKLVPNDGNWGDNFGRSVSIDGSTIVVGTPLKDGHKGAAYVYRAPLATPLQRADTDGNGEIGIPDFLAFIDAFGSADTQFDFNDDGEVNIPDFLIFVNDLFGKPVN